MWHACPVNVTASHSPTLAHNAVCVLHPVLEVGGPWGRGPRLLPDPCRCSAGAAGQGQAGCVPGTGVVLGFPFPSVFPFHPAPIMITCSGANLWVVMLLLLVMTMMTMGRCERWCKL